MLQYSTVIGSSSTKIKDEKGDAGGFEERGENMNSHLGKGSIKKKDQISVVQLWGALREYTVIILR